MYNKYNSKEPNDILPKTKQNFKILAAVVLFCVMVLNDSLFFH